MSPAHALTRRASSTLTLIWINKEPRPPTQFLNGSIVLLSPRAVRVLPSAPLRWPCTSRHTGRGVGPDYLSRTPRDADMIRLIAVTIFPLSVTASAQALTPAPISVPEPDDMITQVAVGCGPGRTRINGVCVARTTIRDTRRFARRCVRWQGNTARCTNEARKMASPDRRPNAIELSCTSFEHTLTNPSV